MSYFIEGISMRRLGNWRGLLVLAALLLCSLFSAGLIEAKTVAWEDRVKALARGGAVMVTDMETGRQVFSLNPSKKYIPASVLKVVTATVALDALGPEYRFTTDFRLTDQKDLLLVGHGDPFLVSEELDFIAQTLKAKGLSSVRNILLDNRYFEPGLILDGTSRSLNPYDAYNGALCVNFNTIYAQIDRNKRAASAEPQTPLTEMALELAQKSGKRGKVRFNLADNPSTCLLYAGDLTKAFLQKAGIQVTGKLIPSEIDPQSIPLFYRHQSRKTLAWFFAQLFKYSNNFMTNQIFLTMGAEKYGPPASPEKSRLVVAEYFKKQNIPPFHMEEGSGLSRLTKLSATQMTSILEKISAKPPLAAAGRPHLLQNRDIERCQSHGRLYHPARQIAFSLCHFPQWPIPPEHPRPHSGPARAKPPVIYKDDLKVFFQLNRLILLYLIFSIFYPHFF